MELKIIESYRIPTFFPFHNARPNVCTKTRKLEPVNVEINSSSLRLAQCFRLSLLNDVKYLSFFFIADAFSTPRAVGFVCCAGNTGRCETEKFSKAKGNKCHPTRSKRNVTNRHYRIRHYTDSLKAFATFRHNQYPQACIVCGELCFVPAESRTNKPTVTLSPCVT